MQSLELKCNTESMDSANTCGEPPIQKILCQNCEVIHSGNCMSLLLVHCMLLEPLPTFNFVSFSGIKLVILQTYSLYFITLQVFHQLFTDALVLYYVSTDTNFTIFIWIFAGVPWQQHSLHHAFLLGPFTTLSIQTNCTAVTKKKSTLCKIRYRVLDTCCWFFIILDVVCPAARSAESFTTIKYCAIN